MNDLAHSAEERPAQPRALSRAERRYLTSRQIKKRYGNWSDMTLWRQLKFHGFPKPLRINNRRYWDEKTLDAHDAALAEAEAA